MEGQAFGLASAVIQAEILKNFALVMQLPVEERPTSQELKELTVNLACYFGSPELREENTRTFVSTFIENGENKAKETSDCENSVKRFCR